MNICQDHWDRLRAKLEERGLSHLIAQDGATAAAMLADRVGRGAEQVLNDAADDKTATPVNFDPLTSAWFAIGGNIMNTIARAGGDPLYLLAPPGTSEDPVEGYGAAGEGKTWPRCGLCYLGLAHELTCRDRRCSLPKKDGYAWMLANAADDALAKAREVGLVAG